jgi:hypothetical protein
MELITGLALCAFGIAVSVVLSVPAHEYAKKIKYERMKNRLSHLFLEASNLNERPWPSQIHGSAGKIIEFPKTNAKTIEGPSQIIQVNTPAAFIIDDKDQVIDASTGKPLVREIIGKSDVKKQEKTEVSK